MQLREKLRMDFSKYIRPIKMKEHCEVCGTTENLELHHVDQFILTLEETLKELNLEEKDCNDYKVSELNNIRNVMLGKQLKQKYLTLCTDCHDKEKVVKRKLTAEEEKLKMIKSTICNLSIGEDGINICYRPYKALRDIEKRLKKREEPFEDIFFDFLQIKLLNPKLDMKKYYKKYPDRY